MRNIFDILDTKDTDKITNFVKENPSSLSEVDDDGNTPLIIACKNNLAEVILKLLDYGPTAVKLSHINDDGETALYESCNKGKDPKMQQVILKMLQFGPEAVRLDQVDDDGYTALHIACEQKLEKIALKMLEFGANSVSLSQVNGDGYTAIMIACENELEPVALKMLEFSPQETNIGQLNADDDTAFQIAIENQMSNVALKMLEFGPEEIGVKLIDNIILDMYDIPKMRNVFLKLLEFSPNQIRLNPLVLFLDRGEIQLDLIDRLLEYGIKHGYKALNLDSINKDGNTALMVACMTGFTTVAVKLLEFGPDAVKLNHVNKDNKTAFIIVCLAKNENIATKMLEYRPEEVNLGHVSKDGSTALLIACAMKLENIALRILDFGNKANLSAISKNRKDTALTFATALMLEKVALKLLEFGPNAIKLSHTRVDGSTALMWAIKNKMSDVASKMLEFGEDATNLQQKTVDGISARIIAEKFGLVDIIKKIDALLAPYQIPHDAEVYDYVMMETHRLDEWLQQDKYNIVIAYNNTYTGMNINDIRDSSNVALFYGCRERSGLIGPNNVLRDIRLYDIQKMGLIINGYIEYDDIERLWKNADIASRLLSLQKSGNKVESVVSSGIMDRQEGLVSGIHCNNDGGYIYKLDIAYIKFGDKPDITLSGGKRNHIRNINEKIKMLEKYILSKGESKLSNAILDDYQKLYKNKL
jgi:ankyrin repeat protein